MFLLLKPGCHMDTIKQLLPTLSWTCASHFTNSLMACPDFPMNSPCISTVVFSCFIYSLTAHSYSPRFIIHIVPYFLVLGHSIPLSYGTCCFYNRWQKLSVPWLPSLSLSHILLLNCTHIVPWKSLFWYVSFCCGDHNNLASYLLLHCIKNIHKSLYSKNPVDRTEGLLHLTLL